MRVRPSAVYRNIGCMLGICLLFCLFYHIIDYDDRFHVDQHHRQKHLYLTVSKDRIAHRFGKLAPKRILMWTRVFGEEKLDDFRDCKGLSDRCIMTSNKSLVSLVDAVVFHAQDIPDTPFPLPNDRRFHQRYVFMTMETPSNSGRHAVPLNFFNWTATYLLSSDVVFKYGPYYLPSKNAEEKGFKLIDLYADESVPKKKSGIFGLVSNCNTISKREIALKELSRQVSQLGSCPIFLKAFRYGITLHVSLSCYIQVYECDNRRKMCSQQFNC